MLGEAFMGDSPHHTVLTLIRHLNYNALFIKKSKKILYQKIAPEFSETYTYNTFKSPASYIF